MSIFLWITNLSVGAVHGGRFQLAFIREKHYAENVTTITYNNFDSFTY